MSAGLDTQYLSRQLIYCTYTFFLVFQGFILYMFLWCQEDPSISLQRGPSDPCSVPCHPCNLFLAGLPLHTIRPLIQNTATCLFLVSQRSHLSCSCCVPSTVLMHHEIWNIDAHLKSQTSTYIMYNIWHNYDGHLAHHTLNIPLQIYWTDLLDTEPG